MLLLPLPAFGAELVENIPLKASDCFKCHGNKNFTVDRAGEKVSLYVDQEAYQKSIHGTNSCLTCHPNTPSIPHKNALHGLAEKNAVNKRCQECHQDIAKEYVKSSHGIGEGYNKPNAYCFDCHGVHNIMKKQESKSLVFKSNLTQTCTKCHEGEIEEAYMESFHGKAVSLGSKTAATCADCHGSHNILGPQEPESQVSKANTPETCAKCHLTPRPNFAEGIEHYSLTKTTPGSLPMYITLKFFTWLTIICISALFVHMEMELYRKLKETKKG